MKSTAKIILLAFVAGIAGAFTFQQFLGPTQVNEIYREAPAVLQQANYSNNTFENNKRNNREVIERPFAAPADFRTAANKSISSVVYIKNLQKNRSSMSFYDYIYGRETAEKEVAIGSGSGVIYSTDGYIITNHHVIEGADEIEVMHEKRTYIASLVGTDPSMDIAVLKIDADNLPAVELGVSSDVRIGDWVLAVGNPFNLTSTVTAGIVSAIGSETAALRENFPLELYIQTDAAINPGNSGGALVNTNGELVGINTSIISKTGSYSGYGFAVPSDVVVKIVEDLKKYKYVQKAYTGADVVELSQEIAKQENLTELKGVFIQSVKKESAAEKAGLEAGDVILSVNNKEVNSKSSFDESITYLSPGDRVNIQFKRDQNLKEANLTLENILGNTEILTSESGLSEKDIHFSDFLGAEMRKLTQIELEQYGLKYGVKVTKIEKETGFMRKLSDIKEGDVIVAINQKWAGDPTAVANYIERFSGRIYIDIIDRNGTKNTLRYRFQ
ncbi:MAG: Do/DeqQ family serine protease [Roseivirga sp.]|jgi:Do/DeqQ family serine protease